MRATNTPLSRNDNDNDNKARALHASGNSESRRALQWCLSSAWAARTRFGTGSRAQTTHVERRADGADVRCRMNPVRADHREGSDAAAG